MEENSKAKKILIAVIVLLLAVILFLIIRIIGNSTRINRGGDAGSVDALVEEITNQLNVGNMSISLDASDEKNVRSAVEAVYDDPEYFWLGRNYSISSVGNMYMIQFSVYYSDYIRMLAESKAVAEEILAGIPGGANQYDTVKYVHDELCNRIKYVNTGDESEHNIYGALVNGECVCEGYAKAFMYILNKAGIETKYFSGTSLKNGVSVPHAWNGAYLDGEFYYFDLTWDDIESEYISYSEFGLNSLDVMRNHTFDEFHPMIESTATKYNYYEYNGLILSEYSKENVADIIKKQDNIIDIKCNSIVAYNKLVLAISNPYQLNEILTAAGSKYTGFTGFSYSLDDSTYCVRLYFN